MWCTPHVLHDARAEGRQQASKECCIAGYEEVSGLEPCLRSANVLLFTTIIPIEAPFSCFLLQFANVDGTLIHSIGKDANKLHKECFTAGFNKVFDWSHACSLPKYRCSVMLSFVPFSAACADVDGTLIHSIGKDANKLHKECFTAGFKEVFGLDTHIDIIPHHGGTDPLIAIKVLEHHGIPKAEVRHVFSTFATYVLI
jgi:hypothetical protein